MEDIARDVPVLVITGFLGAGKSTLVRHLLTAEHGYKIAVVENEMASESMGIEGAIVTAGVDQDVLTDFIELPNGCLCCNVKDDLVDALSRLVQRRSDLDYIIIETSGLADPGPIAALFWVDEDLEMGLRLDGIVAVVDGSAIASGRYLQQDKELFQKQIAMSDVLLLNKMDCVDSSKMSRQEAVDILAAINSSGKVFATTRGVGESFTLSDIFDIGSFRMENAVRHILASSKPTHNRNAEADNRPMTLTLKYPAEHLFDSVLVERCFGKLLWSEKDENGEIWRMKGLLYVRSENSIGSSQTKVYQGVAQSFDGELVELDEVRNPSAMSVIVFIGRKLNRASIDDSMREALVRPR